MVWVWGENKKGELGVGDYSSRIHPYPLVNLKGKEVKSIAVGKYFTIALGNT
jgi:alpha-tubulin suppressor-like RCC1 family protein